MFFFENIYRMTMSMQSFIAAWSLTLLQFSTSTSLTFNKI